MIPKKRKNHFMYLLQTIKSFCICIHVYVYKESGLTCSTLCQYSSKYSMQGYKVDRFAQGPSGFVNTNLRPPVPGTTEVCNAKLNLLGLYICKLVVTHWCLLMFSMAGL